MIFAKTLSLLFLFVSITFASVDPNLYTDWAYDPGPNPETEVGKGYIDIFARIPNFPGLMDKMPRGGVRFRPAFGPTPYRGRTTKNGVKVLVIGQDGTHIAEAAGRTFTGGTGGRMQHVLNYLGINRSYFFINTFAYTIGGQYADWAPYLKGENLVWGQFTNPKSYVLAQDIMSPIVKWRNDLIEHIIDSNRDSLKLIITVGGAAKDTLAAFIRSRGGVVKTFLTDRSVKNIKMVKYKSAWAGGNRSFFYPVDDSGNNILLNDDEKPNYKSLEQQNLMVERAKDKERLERLVLLDSGLDKNGLFDRAQFGYDLDKVFINNQQTNSLKGLVLNSGLLNSDVRFISVPHPGAAGASQDRAVILRTIKRLEERFDRSLSILNDFMSEGWELPSDPMSIDGFFNNKKFYYGRAELPNADFPFGLSKALVVDKSLASRVSGKPHAIEFGGRDRGRYSSTLMNRSEEAEKAEGLMGDDRPWESSRVYRYNFDRGPEIKYAKLLVADLNYDEIFKNKEGMATDSAGVKATNVKNDISHGAFAHYRGTFNKPKIVILADPIDYDGLYSARALTGLAGQRLHGFLQNFDIGDQYLVISTVPFDMTDATTQEWDYTLAQTKSWRVNLLKEILKSEAPQMVLTLGSYADKEIQKLSLTNIPTVSLTNGFSAAFDFMRQRLGADSFSFNDSPQSIPRSHLPYGKQLWVGTSGDRVLRATGNNAGLLYRVVIPKWVIDTPIPDLNAEEAAFIDQVKIDLKKGSSSSRSAY